MINFKKIKSFSCVTVLFATGAFFAQNSFAWNSIGTYTHEKIADDAIIQIPEDEYPDIHKFAEELRDGSETEAHDPPGDERDFDVWAPIYTLWWDNDEPDKKGALTLYKEYDFSKSYLTIGYGLHLLQDTFVPAHTYFCPHGYSGYITDDLEDYADSPGNYGYADGNTPWTFTDDKGREWNYWLNDAMDDDNEDNQPDGATGGSGIIDGPGSNPEPDSSNWGVGSCNWGTYSYGDYWFSFDPLPGKNEGWDYFNQYPNVAIAREKLKGAYIDTIEDMKIRSELLPPIVPDDEDHGKPLISLKIFGPNKPVDISFVAMENRKKTISIFLFAGAFTIKDVSGKVFDGGNTSKYDLSSDSASGTLPWKSTVIVSWRGQTTAGELTDGKYDLKIKVKDMDGKLSEERTRAVKYDKTKPVGTITVNVNPSEE